MKHAAMQVRLTPKGYAFVQLLALQRQITTGGEKDVDWAVVEAAANNLLRAVRDARAAATCPLSPETPAPSGSEERK
jgi:hypothetical protein